MRFASWVTKAHTHTHTHTLTHTCLSTGRKVSRTHRTVTLHLHCLTFQPLEDVCFMKELWHELASYIQLWNCDM